MLLWVKLEMKCNLTLVNDLRVLQTVFDFEPFCNETEQCVTEKIADDQKQKRERDHRIEVVDTLFEHSLPLDLNLSMNLKEGCQPRYPGVG